MLTCPTSRQTMLPLQWETEVMSLVKLHIPVIKVFWYPNPFSLHIVIWF